MTTWRLPSKVASNAAARRASSGGRCAVCAHARRSAIAVWTLELPGRLLAFDQIAPGALCAGGNLKPWETTYADRPHSVAPAMRADHAIPSLDRRSWRGHRIAREGSPLSSCAGECQSIRDQMGLTRTPQTPCRSDKGYGRIWEVCPICVFTEPRLLLKSTLSSSSTSVRAGPPRPLEPAS